MINKTMVARPPRPSSEVWRMLALALGVTLGPVLVLNLVAMLLALS